MTSVTGFTGRYPQGKFSEVYQAYATYWKNGKETYLLPRETSDWQEALGRAVAAQSDVQYQTVGILCYNDEGNITNNFTFNIRG